MTLLTLDDITALLQMRREYVRDTLTKRPDFPRPAIAISQKLRRWSALDVSAWVEKQSAKMAR